MRFMIQQIRGFTRTLAWLPLCPVLALGAEVSPLFPVTIDHSFPEAEATFEEVRSLILENYYTDEVSADALYWAAIEGMLRHVSPPDNPDLGKIWTAKDYEAIFQNLKGVQVSIGVKSSYNANDGSLTITEILPGSPAESILQPYDRILRVDGEALKNLPVTEINDLLKGDEGSSVTLTINRDIKVFDVSIRREQFANENLVVTPLNERVLLIELRRFSEGISEALNTELAEYAGQGFDRMILDLRGNAGGVFSEALKTAEVFLPGKSILLRTFTRENNLQNYVSANEEPLAFSGAVLIDSATGSAAEIVAGALQDHQKALLIGEKTFGKGVFEKTYTLENDFRVKFITGAMYTPKGVAWQSKGIKPDFLVKQESATLDALRKLGTVEQVKRDVAIITALKLVNRAGE